MTDYNDEIEHLDENTESLRFTLSATSDMVTGFDSELRRMRESLADIKIGYFSKQSDFNGIRALSLVSPAP